MIKDINELREECNNLMEWEGLDYGHLLDDEDMPAIGTKIIVEDSINAVVAGYGTPDYIQNTDGEEASYDLFIPVYLTSIVADADDMSIIDNDEEGYYFQFGCQSFESA